VGVSCAGLLGPPPVPCLNFLSAAWFLTATRFKFVHFSFKTEVSFDLC
jgi:hypothetical protein